MKICAIPSEVHKPSSQIKFTFEFEQINLHGAELRRIPKQSREHVCEIKFRKIKRDYAINGWQM